MPPRRRTQATPRPSFDATFMELCRLMGRRTTCPRRGVGAVIVKDKHVLTTGYNGAPKGFPHPVETGCLRDRLDIPSGQMPDICPCLHAEQNAILQAALFGVSVKDSTLYCSVQPCTQCARMIVNAGIRDVVFEQEYRDPLSVGLLTTGGVRLHLWDAKREAKRPYRKINTWEQAQRSFEAHFKAGQIVPLLPMSANRRRRRK